MKGSSQASLVYVSRLYFYWLDERLGDGVPFGSSDRPFTPSLRSVGESGVSLAADEAIILERQGVPPHALRDLCTSARIVVASVGVMVYSVGACVARESFGRCSFEVMCSPTVHASFVAHILA